MKIFSFAVRLPVALCFIWLTGSPAFAQMPSTGSPVGISAAFVKLFGSVSGFTAKVDVQSLDQFQKETLRMPMGFSALDGKVRLEIDSGQMTGKDVSPATISSHKQAGTDRIISIFRPDKKAAYDIYPGIQSYIIRPVARGEAEALEKGLKLKKNALGKEPIEGHPCVKNKVTIRNDKEPVLEATTWNATDLKDFPLQIEFKLQNSTVRMRFSQVELAKPDARQFEVPANFGLMR
jgi:hypothetical protein